MVQVVVEGLDLVLAARHLVGPDPKLEEIAREVADEENDSVPDERYARDRHQPRSPDELTRLAAFDLGR